MEKIAKDLGESRAEMEAVLSLIKVLEGRIDEIRVKQDMGNQNLGVLCHLIAKVVAQNGTVSPDSGMKDMEEVQLIFDNLSTRTYAAEDLN
eukprot:TRINITY_DN9898_c0_g1_i1.p1 TRINITY_DN9898_c0_g1~~TRINITY_DN9898_c0_g1_i1.p1  ORF type:complete len:101 (-),score=28.55 TRINITY_DN9898_c0_g1_i1:133-405(-)